MHVDDFDAETIRLMEEADKLPVIIGPGTRSQISDWEAGRKYFPDEPVKPWVWRPRTVSLERARIKHKRFQWKYLQDCDPSYNTNNNYDPPENIYDCIRVIDTVDGDWYEDHNCPKYKDEKRDHNTV